MDGKSEVCTQHDSHFTIAALSVLYELYSLYHSIVIPPENDLLVSSNSSQTCIHVFLCNMICPCLTELEVHDMISTQASFMD